MSGLHRTYRFTDGRLVKAEPPAWFAKSEANGSWPEVLTAVGAVCIENFGDNEIEIFQGPEGDYFIGIWDANSCIAEVFIDNIADYLQFRASYIAPLAQLVMETERHYHWQKSRKSAA